ncbi:hypothetical protein L613_000800000420 [Pseudoxanthomonas taiwanensis J19]|uniref:Uncharacterized protein n=1 Tax=Pseudoxanthomonas taiwanensis J19 TaxID=935569 RepID=A0A562D1M2_9GAMM|nr:hypothetical protein L613_000800000420 [Pseudoxanthomonas taiwanensis J19]
MATLLVLAASLSWSAWRWPQGARVSPVSTISAVSSTRAAATEIDSRRRDRPSARSAVSSEVPASWPRPSSEPITAAYGKIV